jgi:monofunctional biosynthetic peptidoglycan transglycosylase
MKTITCLCALGISFLSLHADQKPLIDFETEKERPIGEITNDGVMGGLSKGHLKRHEKGSITFSGTLSLENNGGFSLWRIAEGKWDLSASQGLKVRVKGDGRTYKIRLSTDERYRFGRVSFQADLPTTKGTWTDITIPFSDLKASWRGRDLSNKFDPAKIRDIGIILSDKNPGTFEIEVASISTSTPE